MAETKPLCWEFEATVEVSITMTKRVRVKNQEEAGHYCDLLRDEARRHYPAGFIGCGVVAVRLADDADEQRRHIVVTKGDDSPRARQKRVEAFIAAAKDGGE